HPRPPPPTLSPYTTLFRSPRHRDGLLHLLSCFEQDVVDHSPSPPMRLRAAYCLTCSAGRAWGTQCHCPTRPWAAGVRDQQTPGTDRKSTRLNSSHVKISYA